MLESSAEHLLEEEVGRLGEDSPRKAAPSVVEHHAGVQSYQGISEVIVDICQAPWFIVRSIM